jgi:pimeloyl-ACP methyl ester carboxylesterase
MDQRRVLGGIIERLGQGRVIVCGNSMGGGLAVLQAAIEPGSVGGIVLTGSVYPWARGGLPNPAVVGAFLLYDTPPFGTALVRGRMQRLSAERAFRVGLRFCAADPRSIPREVVELHVDLIERHRHDPGAIEAFIETARSMLRLGRRPDVADRALAGVRCSVLVLHGRRDRLVPARFAEATLANHPSWRGRFFPDLGHIPQMEAPGRWVAEVADWFATLRS